MLTGQRALRLLLAVLFIGWSAAARADCPADDPCETVTIYRIQTWPVSDLDAKGRDNLTLQEANGTDAPAFPDVVKAYAGKVTDLAIAFEVIVNLKAPHTYCECVFQDAKGVNCRDKPAAEQAACFRQCGSNAQVKDGACRYSGYNEKTAGRWYSFPDASLCGPIGGDPAQLAGGRTWRKVGFNPKPADCDWMATARTMKSAACIKANLDTSTLPDLFGAEDICPTVVP